MESKLLVGGKNIVDHTNEQQRILEQKRKEIAEQVSLCPAQESRAVLQGIQGLLKCAPVLCL